MRIVVVSWRDLAHPQAGGSELLVDRLLVGLAARGHDVALVCGGPIGIRPYPVRQAGGTYSQYLLAPWRCATEFRRADVIVDVSNGVPFFSPLWRRRPSVCLALHFHAEQWNTRFPRPLAAAARLVERRGIPAVYRNRPFVAISESTATAFQAIGINPAHITVIEPGVETPTGAAPPKSAEPLFVALNRLVPHKRVDLLLEAWRTVQPVTGGRFVVIGAGPELEALRHMAAPIPGAEVRGYVDDTEKVRLLAEAWFLVQASSHEGWGIASVEAAVCGTPTLAINAPGVRDAVIDGLTGTLVDAETPAAFAAAWIDFSANGSARVTMGDAAKKRALSHTWDRMVDDWARTLSEATSTRPAGSFQRAQYGQPRPRAANLSDPVE